MSDIFTEIFNCPKLRVYESNKSKFNQCGVAEWLQDLWEIIEHNKSLSTLWSLFTKISDFSGKQIDAVAKTKKLDENTIKALREIASFAAPFNLPLKKSAFNVYGTKEPYPTIESAHETSYTGLLRKYADQLKTLNNDQLKNLNNLLKTVKSKTEALATKSQKISYSAWQKLINATRDISYAMDHIDSDAGSVAEIKANVAVCKKEMANKSLQKTIKSSLDKLSPMVEQLSSAEQNLLKDIEAILKKE